MMKLWIVSASVFLISAQISEAQLELHQVVVTVTDDAGRLVRNLGPDDFVVRENDFIRPIERMTYDSSLPISIGLLVDVSGSMEDAREGVSARTAAQALARIVVDEIMRPGDQFALMSFAEKLDVRQNLTSQKAEIQADIGRLGQGNRTDLVGALSGAVNEMRSGPHGSQALILISDRPMWESLSQNSNGLEVGRSLLATEIPVFTMIIELAMLPQAYTERIDLFGLDDDGSDSQLVKIHARDMIETTIEFLAGVEKRVRGQYTLSYFGTGSGSSRLQRLRVRTVEPKYDVWIRPVDQ